MHGYIRDVLLVEHDPAELERLAAALEGDGFDVRLCSGPAASDHSCIGIHEGRCQLATDACIVVLDMALDGDAGAAGLSAERLLRFYLEADHRVVTLNPRSWGIEDPRLISLTRHPEAPVLLAAVWRLASPNLEGP